MTAVSASPDSRRNSRAVTSFAFSMRTPSRAAGLPQYPSKRLRTIAWFGTHPVSPYGPVPQLRRRSSIGFRAPQSSQVAAHAFSTMEPTVKASDWRNAGYGRLRCIRTWSVPTFSTVELLTAHATDRFSGFADRFAPWAAPSKTVRMFGGIAARDGNAVSA